MSGSGTTCTSGSPCTLAEVLSSATSGDTVDLAPGTYQPAGDTSFTISTSITVQSATPGSTVTLEGNGASVLGVDSSVTATVSGVSIEDGLAGVDGGGIDNSGTLTVQDSTIAGNAAQYAGGGIYNSGTLTVEDSTISGNSAGAGGGIYNSNTLSVEDSTIFANTALACVDGVDSSGQLCVAPFDGGGGGIYNQGTGTIEASTLTANSVNTGYGGAFGGGINNSDDNSLTLAADIIAEQSAGGDCSNSLIPVTDAGYNVDDDGTCGLSASNNSISDSTVIDDYLGTLGANGGPTETVPLLATASPTTSSADPALGVIPSTFDLPIALNGVSLACSIPDQRGVTPDQPCDMGAFSLTLDTVAFTADGGGAVASITGLDGSSITLPSDTYPGYSFTGWFTAASGGTEVGGAGASYAISLGGVTLYAQWSANATDDYSFNAAGGAPTPTAGSGLDGTTITLPGTPTRAAYTFAGWNDGTTTYGASSPYTLSSGGKPIVFTAQWSAAMDNYSFNTAGGSPTPTAGSGSNGTTITLPAAPTQAGYTFAGWSVATTNPSGEMAPPAGYSASQEVLEDQFANLNNWNTYYGPGTPWQNRGKLPSPYSGGNQPNSNDMAYYSPTQDVLMSGGGVSLEATPNNQFSSQGYTLGERRAHLEEPAAEQWLVRPGRGADARHQRRLLARHLGAAVVEPPKSSTASRAAGPHRTRTCRAIATPSPRAARSSRCGRRRAVPTSRAATTPTASSTSRAPACASTSTAPRSTAPRPTSAPRATTCSSSSRWRLRRPRAGTPREGPRPAPCRSPRSRSTHPRHRRTTRRAPPTPSRAGARPSSSPPSGAPTRPTTTASTRRAARRPRPRAPA